MKTNEFQIENQKNCLFYIRAHNEAEHHIDLLKKFRKETAKLYK